MIVHRAGLPHEVMHALLRLCAVTEERCLTPAEAEAVRRAVEWARTSGPPLSH